MSQVLRYTPSLKPGLMIEDAEGKWAKYEVLAELVAQCGADKETLERWHELNLQREAKVEAMQQRLTAADELADLLLGLLREARQHHGVMLMSDPPQDAWKYHRMNERIDAVLNAKH
ncbi:hypothetical protein [Pseudomonas sp. PS01296]|uniref:hypothetical protein n=1 Tax=Pseudomonas sp. PS01296 TaxID=2991432 RepID=UPI00249B0A6C|nr:hypothetical protein [Pseudomonas sp. PS01296]